MRTFRIGGIHPPENKISARKTIQTLSPPVQAVIPLSQSLGVPSSPIVKKGDPVKVGTLIARANGFVSANIHSPVSGVVAKIDDTYDLSGYRRPAIYIDVVGDEWEDSIDRSESLIKDNMLSSDDIIDRITKQGVVGLGGATFPTHVKLISSPGKKVDVLLINAVECEPYLTSDHQLMLENPDEILVGIQLLMKAVKVQRAIIGIENNKGDAIGLLTEKVKAYPGIEVITLKVKYPQGGEKQLIDAVLHRQIPGGALPVDAGAVVLNVGTAFAVYEAIQKNKPLVERIVTVTGKSIKSPANFRVRIGTPLQQLIDAAGGLPEDTGKIVAGGPMMGKSVASIEIPVVKGCSGILIMPSLEAQRAGMKTCIRCAKCVAVCPMGLEPYLLGSIGEMMLWEHAERERVMDCIECGCCSYTCPANRPLVDFIRLGKSKVGAMIRSRK